jgi:hypothetical protein
MLADGGFSRQLRPCVPLKVSSVFCLAVLTVTGTALGRR